MSNKTAYILVGVPGSGKSTWLREIFESHYATPHNRRGLLDVISSDDYVDNIASLLQTTYSEIFSSVIGIVDKAIQRDFDRLLTLDQELIDEFGGVTVYIDRTNLTVKTRSRWVKPLIAAGYRVNAIVFPTPEKDEWNFRLASRPGKIIPQPVLDNMVKTFEFPTREEGFDYIGYSS